MGGERCGHVWKMMSNILSEMYSEKSSNFLQIIQLEGRSCLTFDETQADEHIPRSLRFNLCGIHSSCACKLFPCAACQKVSNALARGGGKCKTIANHYK
jgi:hypothetical protein